MDPYDSDHHPRSNKDPSSTTACLPPSPPSPLSPCLPHSPHSLQSSNESSRADISSLTRSICYKAAATKILSFVENLQFQKEDLRITAIDTQTYWELVSLLENHNKVNGDIIDSVRYNYNEYNQTFTVKCMPASVHDVVQSFFSREIGNMYKIDFLTAEEYELLSLHFGADDFLPSGSHRHRKQKGVKKGSGVRKQADVSVTYGDDDTEFKVQAFPSMVWEVGFSESYTDLLEDARQWLEGSCGGVRLVIVVKLEEVKKGTVVAGPSEEASNSQPSPGSGDSEQVDNEPGSDPASYQELRRSCKVDDWVGPINAFLEVWRYNKSTGKMKQDGERIILLPPPNSNTKQVLQITKADLKGTHSTVEDEEQVYALDLDKYSTMLTKARRQLACSRMVCELKRLRKQKRTKDGDMDSDSDYNDEGPVGGGL